MFSLERLSLVRIYCKEPKDHLKDHLLTLALGLSSTGLGCALESGLALSQPVIDVLRHYLSSEAELSVLPFGSART